MPFFIHQFAGLPYPPSDPTKAQADAFNIPAWRQSLIVSILSAGTFFGALIAGDLADFIGRRLTIIFGCAVFTLGVVLQASTGIFLEHMLGVALSDPPPPAETQTTQPEGQLTA
jgi:SP family sugar:H+ symporter-like MFS transporter